jgi:excalibur calcium-binding domain-containing protein
VKKLLIAMVLVLSGCSTSAGQSNMDSPPKPQPEQSLLDYCIQEYAAFNARHPEMKPVLTPAQQCQAGIDEGVLINKQAVDAIIKAADEVYAEDATGPGDVYYSNCTEAKDKGAAPLHKGQPGYRSELDRDNDGIACSS